MAKMLDLDAEAHRRINAAVAQAEAGTSGEIVTIIAGTSDDYADIALWWSAGFAFLALGVLCLFPDFYLAKIDWILGRWAVDWTPRALFELVLTTIVMKFVASWLILQWQPLRLWLVPGPVRTARVHKRAVALFKVAAERRTQGRTGILLYLSLAEHRAEILADEAIHSRVAHEEWGKAMADLILHVRDGRMAEGMIAAIQDIGEILGAHLPAQDNDKNELPDRLMTL